MMANILRLGLLVLYLCVYVFGFYSNTKFLNEGFVNYEINGHVFKEFRVFGEREIANCSGECIKENDCNGFEICQVDLFQICRLSNASLNPKASVDSSASCQHFLKLSHELHTCDGFSTTNECIGISSLISATTSSVTLQTATSGSYPDCSDCDCVFRYTSVSGFYEITSPVTNNSVIVECVMKDGYGYTIRQPGKFVSLKANDTKSREVILQRHDGSVDFNRTYAEYQTGFGSPFTEMWLGNDYFHYLTSSWVSGLYIEFKYSDSSFRCVDYYDVIIYDHSRNYTLKLATSMTGNASDVLGSYLNYPFGAYDLDANGCRCTVLKYGGWWHGCCSYPCGLTMPYNDPTYSFGWDCSTETAIKLTSVKMMTRRG